MDKSHFDIFRKILMGSTGTKIELVNYVKYSLMRNKFYITGTFARIADFALMAVRCINILRLIGNDKILSCMSFHAQCGCVGVIRRNVLSLGTDGMLYFFFCMIALIWFMPPMSIEVLRNIFAFYRYVYFLRGIPK